MKPGEKFEKDCVKFLMQTYKINGVTFYLEGGMDSTKSDIAVIKNDCVDFYIEVKDTDAQSGQFVLYPDKETETFVFSPKNKSEQNEMTEIMIQYMNNDFYRFDNAGTAGEALNIETSVFSDWIVNHYTDKKVKYFISYKNGFVICPIRKFSSYFKITAKYRIKKSGSSNPAKRDFEAVKNEIKSLYQTAFFSEDGSKLFATFNESVTRNRFVLGKYTYYISNRGTNFYEIKRLSNTYNMNVIFSIQLNKNQAIEDLTEFEDDLKN